MALDRFETLEDVNAWCVQQLERAAVDKNSSFRWPVLCTAGPAPQGRVVVLRQFNRTDCSALFYTDRRSGKCNALSLDAAAECVFFDAKRMVQIRASGSIELVTDGALKADHFRRIKERVWQDYGSERGPGTITDIDEPILCTEEAAAHHFCVLKLSIEIIDWLCLGRGEHKRARLDWSGKAKHCWLVP
ncbi:MAG: hypothetical protein AAFY34_01310 [Pseudomonadota bacterium]